MGPLASDVRDKGSQTAQAKITRSGSGLNRLVRGDVFQYSGILRVCVVIATIRSGNTKGQAVKRK